LNDPHNGPTKRFRQIGAQTGSVDMSEADLDLLLEAVRTEITAEAQDDFFSEANFHCAIPVAANDNSMEWPLVPFPDGWSASC
jgi:hypothetical protein